MPYERVLARQPTLSFSFLAPCPPRVQAVLSRERDVRLRLVGQIEDFSQRLLQAGLIGLKAGPAEAVTRDSMGVFGAEQPSANGN